MCIVHLRNREGCHGAGAAGARDGRDRQRRRRGRAKLVAASLPVRAAAGHVDSVRRQFGDGVEAIALDFTDPETWPAAYTGSERMFLLRPPQLGKPKTQMLPSLEQACSGSLRFAPPVRRQDFVKETGRGVRVSYRSPFRGCGARSVNRSWQTCTLDHSCGGPMTVVAGIVALLLLGYLVVALIQPERF